MEWKWFKSFLLCVAVVSLASISSAQEVVKIGVLAKDGPAKALSQWKSTGDYLTANVTGVQFEVVPLDFKDVNPAVKEGTVDFFLVNSSMFVETKVKYGAVAVATMVNSRQGKPLKAFGGVVIATVGNDQINNLNDLKGKSFMAVSKSSFGGWQMAYKEILDAGIDPFSDFSKLEFGGKHENVVLAVLNGAVDAGTVRTDTLERMAASGSIFLDDFKVIGKQSHPEFPFLCSTALYPEWPLARISSTPVQLSDKVVEALMKLKPEDQAAKDAKVVGWSASLDYGPVEELQKKLKIGAYAN
ncbi:phosphate/phosphite/phosphonate ABC transporter substrate-binding protein [Desulfatitalea tepidiphila]|uniref:phosphate/phosphite/phosphonate ABC transporter substrate-binding protein n=1 Tax=Desulfatitalea tepidiphila TaxID=1185843 RepID=UPI0006B42155|nr:PhnD/SsuA/transferrin family substrate-binding protein [Desulfatitalea tepidiphila]